MAASAQPVQDTHQLRIRIVARRQPEPEESDNSGLSWLVDIYRDDCPTAAGVRLEDPWDSEQKTLCQWYLQKHVYKFPYSVDEAADARARIDEYGARLIEKLNLRGVIEHGGAAGRTAPTRSVSVEVADYEPVSAAANTIHQLHWELLEEPAHWGQTDDNLQVTVKRCFPAPDEPASTSPAPAPSTRARACVNILLVVARDTESPDLYDEVDPTLASEVLLQMRGRLRASRSPVQLNVEMVRPGTLEALGEHLVRAEAAHGRGFFDVVHLDMHGQVGLRSGHGGRKFGFLYFEKTPGEVAAAAATAVRGRRGLLGAVRPAQVARLLARHGVGLAVLNACESARARSGDDANIAGALVRGGVPGVLAMSFKISRDAAAIFLAAFYRELLTAAPGSSLSQAVAAGRRALRAEPLRSARLEMRRELADWFVPVLYYSGPDPVLLASEVDDNMSATVSPPPIIPLEPMLLDRGGAPDTGLVLRNRDFDLLRFERILSYRRRVCLHGPTGVGKTTFLSHAVDIWEQTRFVDHVIYVDMEKDGVKSADDFCRLIIERLQEKEGSGPDATLKSLTVKESSDGHDGIADMLQQYFAASRLILIIDHLHGTHPGWVTAKYMGSSFPDEKATSEFADVLRTLLGISESPDCRGQTREGTYLVCVSRHGHLDGRLEGELGVSFDRDSDFMELPGLSHPDSVDLAHRIFRQQDGDRAATQGSAEKPSRPPLDSWEQGDHEVLDQVIGLLQGSPAALMEVLPLSSTLGIPWQAFYQRLCLWCLELATDASSPLEVSLSPSRVARELLSLSQRMPAVEFLALALLSLFWNHGPLVQTMAEALDAFCVGSPALASPSREGLPATAGPQRAVFEDHVGAALAVALDLGYVQLGPAGQVMSVHPLLSLWGRGFVRRWLNRCQKTRDGDGSAPYPEVAIESPGGSLADHNPTLSTARLPLLSTVGRFMVSATARSCGMTTLRSSLLGVEIEEMALQFSQIQANVVACVEILCTTSAPSGDANVESSLGHAKHPAPVDEWPLLFFQTIIPFHNVCLATFGDRALFASIFHQLLEGFLCLFSRPGQDGQPTRLGAPRVPIEYQGFVLLLYSTLANTWLMQLRSDKAFLTKGQELCLQAMEMLRVSDDPSVDKRLSDGDYTCVTALISRTIFLSGYSKILVCIGKVDEARGVYEMLVAAEGKLCEAFASLPEGRPVEFSAIGTTLEDAKLISLFNSPTAWLGTADLAAAVAAERQAQVSSLQGRMKKHYTDRHFSQEVAHWFEAGAPDSDKERQAQIEAESLEAMSRTLRSSNELMEMTGVRGVNRLEEFWPQDFSMLSFCAGPTDELSRLRAIEKATAAGNWFETVTQHRTLMWSAWREFDHEKALGHMDTLLDLYRSRCRTAASSSHDGGASYEEEMERLVATKSEMCDFYDTYRAVSALAEGQRSVTDIMQQLRMLKFQASGPQAEFLNMWESFITENVRQPVMVNFKRGWVRRLMKIYAAKQQRASPKVTAEEFARGLQETIMDACMQIAKLATAWEGDDMEAIERELKNCEGVFADDLVKASFSAMGAERPLQQYQTAFELRRTITEQLDALQSALGRKDFGLAAQAIQVFEDRARPILSQGADDPPGRYLSGVLASMKESRGTMLYEAKTEALKAAHVRPDPAQIEALCDELISEWEDGALPSVGESRIVFIRTTRVRALMSTAIQEGKWQRGVSLSDDMDRLRARAAALAQEPPSSAAAGSRRWDEEQLRGLRDCAVDNRELCQLQQIGQDLQAVLVDAGAPGSRARMLPAMRDVADRLELLFWAQKRASAEGVVRTVSRVVGEDEVQALRIACSVAEHTMATAEG